MKTETAVRKIAHTYLSIFVCKEPSSAPVGCIPKRHRIPNQKADSVMFGIVEADYGNVSVKTTFCNVIRFKIKDLVAQHVTNAS